jgi:APA family basic amino acid/polyamine antiporter
LSSTRSILRRKSVEASLATAEDPERSLKRDLTAWDLAVLGVAVAVGAGIFSVGATAAANHAGPGVILSFLIASVVCGLAIMCYAEFASTLPVAGSAYTFSYATMGEVVAWIIGWDLILEMLLAAAVIAKFWGVYLSDAFGLFGVDVPTTLHLGGVDLEWGPVLVVGVFTTLLAVGTKLSTRINSVFTILKVGITLFVIVAGFFYVKAENYTPWSASCPARRWCSSRSSASTSWPPRPRRPRTRSGRSRAACSAAWRSSRCSTCW